jgi:HD-GYP domain-containing protein (c-di-GMP phosphodiesterase class II)
MTSKRHYSRTRTIQDAIAELVACSGSQFDAEVVPALAPEVAEGGLVAEPELLDASLPQASVGG